MRAFLHVSRTGSFTRAAELAHMTQAGLSLLVREMERQLGARLFDRTTRAVQLTAAGRRMAPVVERVLLELDGITEEIGVLGDTARQQLRIAATPLVSSQLLPRLLASFGTAHPRIGLKLLDGSLEQVGAMVAAGEADLGLGFFFRQTAGLARTPVAKFPLMRVSKAQTQPQSAGRATWTSLHGSTLIGLPPGNPIQKVIDAQLSKLGLIDGASASVGFFSTLISMVEAGFGTAVMPSFAMSACRRHNVKVDLLTGPKVELTFYRITKRGVAETDAMAAFAQMLADQLPSMSR
jgi:DNA-binding transcriptional LysR family regulator